MVLIGCPVSAGRAELLDIYIERAKAQDYKGETKIFFVVNNADKETIKVIKKHKCDYVVKNNPSVMKDDRNKINRRRVIYYWLAELRNTLLDKAIELHASHLLSCDSDILMRPDTLSRLLEHNLPAVSALVYNGYLHCPDEPWRYPNILKWNGETYRHQATYHVKNNALAPYGKLLETDFTGACILIRKDMFHHRYDYYIRGEDEPMCRSIREAGYKIYCDVSILQTHIMEV